MILPVPYPEFCERHAAFWKAPVLMSWVKVTEDSDWELMFRSEVPSCPFLIVPAPTLEEIFRAILALDFTLARRHRKLSDIFGSRDIPVDAESAMGFLMCLYNRS